MSQTQLFPVLTRKISKDDWLITSIPYDDTTTVKDILRDMCTEAYEWIRAKDNLTLTCDYDSFEEDFISMMYHKYVDERI